jgi:hypothetical protein
MTHYAALLHHALHGVHVTPAVIGLIIAAAIVLALVTPSRAAPAGVTCDGGPKWVPITVIGLVGVVVWYAATGKAPKAPAPRVITHVITHVVTRPGKPALTGTEIAVIICAGLVVVLVIALNRRAR